MIASSHLIAGTAVGALCPRARIAIPVAFASHFVLDQIPHSCFNELPASVWTWPVGIASFGGGVLAYLLAAYAMALAWRLPTRWVSVATAIAAFAPDPLSYMPPVNQWFALLPGSSCVPWIHGTFHCDVTKTHPVLGFATQVVVIGAGLYILSRRNRTKSML